MALRVGAAIWKERETAAGFDPVPLYFGINSRPPINSRQPPITHTPWPPPLYGLALMCLINPP
jgi:hypothetical protein